MLLQNWQNICKRFSLYFCNVSLINNWNVGLKWKNLKFSFIEKFVPAKRLFHTAGYRSLQSNYSVLHAAFTFVTTQKKRKRKGRKCQHLVCSQPLSLKGEATHLGSVWKARWVHLSPHKHVGSSLQESFLAFKETECWRSKNQSKSTTWLLIKPEKSGETQTVYQWIILPNPRTQSPGFNKLFKDFTHFFPSGKKKNSISCVAFLALLNWEC